MSELTIKSAEQNSQPEKPNCVLKTTLLPLANGTGSVFGLTRILGKPDEKRERIAEIINEGLAKLAQDMQGEANPARRFEQALQFINEDLGQFMSQNTPMSLTEFHSVIGIVANRQIYLSGSGKLMTLFMHQTGKKRFVIYELDEQFEPPEERNWQKPFLTVLDGEMNAGDIFYLATRVPARECTLQDLQEILVTLPPSGALKRIQQHVSFGESYGGVTFQVADLVPSGPPMKENPITSLDQFSETQNKTASILGEQTPNIRKSIEKLTAPLLKLFPSSSSRGAKSTLIFILQIIVKLIALIFVLILAGLRFLIRGIAIAFKAIYKLVRDRERKDALKEKLSKFWKRIKYLPPRSRYLAAGALVTLLILIGGANYLHHQKDLKKADEAFEVIATRIDEKTDEAEARLIYDDTAQARTLLNDATTLLASLPTGTDAQKTRKAEYESQIQTILDSIRQSTPVTPTLLADMGVQDATKQFVLSSEAGDVVYGITSASELYRLNELSLVFEPITTTNGSIGYPVRATGSGSNLLFVDPTRNLGKIDPTNKTINPVTSGAPNLQAIDAITLYNDNLYVLNSSAEQIIKMRPQGEGYDAGTNWIITKNSSLANARDLTIDGDVFVLTSAGIVRFTSGREVSFPLGTLEPALKNPREIWTTVGTDYLYILDAGESRVIVYKKDGTLVAQYTAAELGNAISFTVREASRTILFSTATAVYSFPASHLVQ